MAVESFLKERLPPLVPGAVFFGEEETENADPRRGWAFIVDPWSAQCRQQAPFSLPPQIHDFRHSRV